jgi:hypothetical protein
MQIKINNKLLNSQVLKNPETHKMAPGAEYIGVRMQHPTEAAQVLKQKAHHQTDSQDVPVVICYGINIHDGVVLKFKPYTDDGQTKTE